MPQFMLLYCIRVGVFCVCMYVSRKPPLPCFCVVTSWFSVYEGVRACIRSHVHACNETHLPHIQYNYLFYRVSHIAY